MSKEIIIKPQSPTSTNSKIGLSNDDFLNAEKFNQSRKRYTDSKSNSKFKNFKLSAHLS